MVPLWLTLDRNLEFWSTGALLGSGQRIEFEGSELVWQYYPGQGLQIQVLGNFGKLNGLWGSQRRTRGSRSMLDELLPLAAERAGGVAWEYYFTFGGGNPPWVSGLAQGTARPGARARGHAAAPRGRRAAGRPARRWRSSASARPTASACPPRTATTTRSTRSRPNLRVLNGFIQSLVGLYDYARIAKDPQGTELFQTAEPEARAETPLYDTGAWSLYSRGSSHARVLALLPRPAARASSPNLCKRTRIDVYCTTADHFVAYKSVAPVLTVHSKTLRGGRYGRVRFELSKISNVTLHDHAQRQGRRVAPVRRRRLREAHVRLARAAHARDLRRDARGDRPGGQPATAPATTVRVLKPKKKKRP